MTWAPPYTLAVEPLVVLFVLPVLIGILSEVLFRDTTRASCVATFASPLAIALALAAVMVCFGRTHVRRRPQRNGA